MGRMTDSGTTTEAIFTISQKALSQVHEVRGQEANADELALWIEINGVSAGQFTYDLWFQPTADAGDEHVVLTEGEVPVVIAQTHVDDLRGATLDMSRDLINPGLVINNPNKPSIPGVGDAPANLEGDTAQKIVQLLAEQINPAIASHGGGAELVGVDQGTAYIRLSGGCQGCSMSRATLSQGIEVAIRDAVPEIVRVVDVTDHASGENPFYS